MLNVPSDSHTQLHVMEVAVSMGSPALDLMDDNHKTGQWTCKGMLVSNTCPLEIVLGRHDHSQEAGLGICEQQASHAVAT